MAHILQAMHTHHTLPTFSLYGCPSTTSGAMYAHDPTASVRLYLQQCGAAQAAPVMQAPC